MRTGLLRVPFLFLVAVLLFTGHSRALPADPAARGLDVFLHVSPDAAPGASIELTAEAFGFPIVTHASPLAGATIEAGWDPEELDGEPPPPSVTSVTDREGRARIVLTVPPGLPRDLQLLVSVRHGSHARTREVKIARTAPAWVELHTADTRVVPTSTISAWIRVVGPKDEPLADAPVEVSLLEGGVARYTDHLRADRGGLVMARVPIPRIDEPVWKWTLRARAELPGSPPSDIELTPREENPGTPSLAAEWEAPPSGAKPGDHVPFTIRVRDATGQPVVDHAIQYWVGVKGTSAPAGKEWDKLATRATTDGAGEVHDTRDAPTLVKSTGTSLVLVARSELEGHVLDAAVETFVGVPNASATLEPEVAALVPGVTQKMMLRVLDGRSEGVAGAFQITGDGLSETVTTDTRGEAELTWKVPLGVGASRNVGPCAGGVAAAVTVRPIKDLPQLRSQREAFTICLSIDRDIGALVRIEPNLARPGEKVRVSVIRTQGAPKGFSALLRSNAHAQSIATWLEAKGDGNAQSEITIPIDAAGGLWSASVALPDGMDKTRVLGASLLIVPAVAPLLEVKRTGGRAAPGGTIDVEARLTDGHGHGLPGTVSSIVVDAFGGGTANVDALDTRKRLCSEIGALDRCAEALDRAPATDALRRASLARRTGPLVAPINDPGAHVSAELRAAFENVLKSLEGAVYESTKNPQSLIDVRRKDNGRWVFNPELLTLVTDAMTDPPLTPGGEKLTLPDLVAVDPQVSFDVVARRVTRLKLFKVLAAVREVRTKGGLDPDEPVFKDPNALLRRLVRKNGLAEDLLLDPWGGTIQFVRGAGIPTPFLSVIHGWELHAPGPDGIVGTGDDVKDPFERVVRSKTPYAEALFEDKLVDAKWDMLVSEETVRAWDALFAELTGTVLGNGLEGYGEGGGGSGSGIGLGNIGTLGHGAGTGRGSAGIVNGDAYWSPPVRTDAEGRVHLAIPLGDAETTWRIAFVGVPDGLGPASQTLDVPSELPLSARVDGGARWVEGDLVETRVIVRNRTDKQVTATVSAIAEDAAALADPKRTQESVVVPAKGARVVRFKVKALRVGNGKLTLTTRAPGLADDVLHHAWEIVAPGEQRALTQTAWVDGERSLGLALDHGYRLDGIPRIVLERGYDDAIAAALDSLEPERQTSTLALADAVEAAVRIERWASTKSTPRHKALAGIAESTTARALGRFHVYAALDGASKAVEHGSWTLHARIRGLSKTEPPAKEPGAECPPQDEDALDVEPPPDATIAPCWGAYVGERISALQTDDDPERLAIAINALADRPHRAAVVAVLADRLRRVAKLSSTGDIAGPRERAPRAIVYAALLRAQRLGTSTASADVLFGKLAVLRDVTGGYGSSTATLYVVRALLASQLEGHGVTRARIRVAKQGQAPFDRNVDVPESGFMSVALPPGTLDVEVETQGAGLVARFERPVLRLWSRPPPPQESPVSLETIWPAEAVAGRASILRVKLKHTTWDARDIDVRIPLPPGASLAGAVGGASQIQGALFIRQTVDRSGAVLEIPIRFGLGGTFTAPEANARIARAPSAPAIAPARPVVVR